MAILRAVELMMGVVILLMAAVMFRWWLEADESGGVPINTNYCPNCGQKLWWNK